ncbi:MAG: TIGR03617 family F420-dependent LLM class oxidoreductase [Chloroflexi bacterium]|nr:TIGR03617 family F420-dependent LLM class oxidoreductase [Chloroflexota bacterium]
MEVIYRLANKDLKTVAEEAKWAESVGYDGVSSNESAHDPFMPLALAATATRRPTLETRVAIAFPRSPMVVAYAAWDLQAASDGRFKLGLGPQVKGHNERRFSVKWLPPGPRMREYVKALHAIWDNWQDNKKLDFKGDYYTFTLMNPMFNPGPIKQPRPKVYLAGVNPYNCRVAGEVADGLMLHSLNTATYVRKAILPHVAEGAKAAGRNPADVKINGGGFVITGPNRQAIDEIKPQVRQQAAFYASTRTYKVVLDAHGWGEKCGRLHAMSLEGKWREMANEITDEMLNEFAVIGEYDDVAGKIKERFGGIVQELSFNMPVKGADAETHLKRIIRDLKS